MSAISIAILAFGMSIDAFIAAMGHGAARRHTPLEALRTGLIFGIVETITPLIGWALGKAASAYVQQFDHWIAFALLMAVGGHMVWEGLKRDRTERPGPARKSLLLIVVTAVGTSIDAMAVGVSLALLDVAIIGVAIAIGAATTLMASCGILFGRLISRRFSYVAEIIGGLALIGIGVAILYEHLG